MKESIDSLIKNHANIDNFPILLKGYNEGYLKPEDVLLKLDKVTEYCPSCGNKVN
tara:strand:+ start:405 stop:569 length:165 start_codon:yes stop_codon:yes gene_type:complete